MITERILIVDDEPLLLELYKSQLGDEFSITTVTSGDAALRMLSEGGTYAIIVADMHMPEMNGVEFLRRSQGVSPRSVKMMLTADINQLTAVDALNSASVFRFLNKPCPAEQLAVSIRAGLEQHHLRCAETQLLASTVSGSINLMGDVLAIVNPVAFGKARRVTRIVDEVCRRLSVADSWELTMAAMLSQLGCISLPDSLIPMAARGEHLSATEDELWRSHPRIGHDLISKIPRLERVADIVLLQHSDYRSAIGAEVDECETVEWRAGCLRAALELDARIKQQVPPLEAIRQMRSTGSAWPLALVDVLESIVLESSRQSVRFVAPNELRPGMILDENLCDVDGRVLLTKGQQIADWLITRLHRLGLMDSVRNPVRIVDPAPQLELSPICPDTAKFMRAAIGSCSLVGAA